MSGDRVVPPSPRRIALARRAGMVARSPVLVAGGAWAGAVLALVVAAGRARAALGGALAAGAAAAGDASPGIAAVAARDVIGAAVGVVAPLAVGAALGALAFHLAQTRGLAIPRRAVTGAPRPARGAGRRVADAGARGARGAAVAVAAAAWLAAHGGDLVDLGEVSAAAALAYAAALVASAAAYLAVALLLGGAAELGVAVLRHRADLRMTRREAADDARAAGIDPRWRRERSARAPDPTAAVHTARLVVAGDGAVAVRYHERVAPRPTVVAVGRGVDATRVLERARRHRVPIHHAPLVARALATTAPGDAVPVALWPAIAELVATDARP